MQQGIFVHKVPTHESLHIVISLYQMRKQTFLMSAAQTQFSQTGPLSGAKYIWGSLARRREVN